MTRLEENKYESISKSNISFFSNAVTLKQLNIDKTGPIHYY